MRLNRVRVPREFPNNLQTQTSLISFVAIGKVQQRKKTSTRGPKRSDDKKKICRIHEHSVQKYRDKIRVFHVSPVYQVD